MLVSDQGTGFHGYMTRAFLVFQLVYRLTQIKRLLCSVFYTEDRKMNGILC